MSKSAKVRATHTPGPWLVERRNGYHDVLTEEGETLAKVYDVTSGDGVFSNVRLMAASHEMLEALELLADSDSWFGREWLSPKKLGQVRAAVRKAKGE